MRFVVPTGNFGDILAGYFATRMGLPTEKLVVATNENDILHRFWQTGWYEKKPVHGKQAEGGFPSDGSKAHGEGVKETMSPAMDILVSSNFERLLWYLAFETSEVTEINRRRMEAGHKVKWWLMYLKMEGGFSVNREVLEAAQELFESHRVSDEETIATIRDVYSWTLPSASHKMTNGSASNGTTSSPTTGTEHNGHYILDPHTAIGVKASLRSISSSVFNHHIALATAHPAKFSHAVELALKDEPDFSFESVLPEQFVGMEDLPKRVTSCKADWKSVKEIVIKGVGEELKGLR